MSNEPIMIDDVDVAECKLACHYTKDRTYCNATDSLCKEEPNYYYKQLKRKEQEIDDCREELHWLHNQLDQLKAENKELQEKIKAYDEVYSNHDALKEAFNNAIKLSKIYKKQIFKSSEKALKYSQALQEIFKCLIMANRADKITETLWIDNSTTLWDYFALTLELEGDQLEIEEQILRGDK